MSQILLGPVCLLLLAGCQSSPGGYALRQGFEQRLTKLKNRILDPTYLASEAGRLRHLFATGGSLATREARGPRLATRSIKRSVSDELARVTSTGKNLGSLPGTGFGDAGRRLNRLAKIPSRARLNLGRRLRNLRSFGDRLGLGRQILPMPGDASRNTEILPRGRRAGLLERIFARIRP